MENFFVTFFMGVIGGTIIGVYVCSVVAIHTHQKSLVEHDYGQYCPADGHFAFKGECDK